MAGKKKLDLWRPWDLPEEQAEDIATETKESYDLLDSTIDSLYRDFKELSKKPKEWVTPLALETINAVIRDAKEILAGDRYVDRIGEFVAAGENPPNSDAMLILGQLKTALERFRETWYVTWNQYDLN